MPDLIVDSFGRGLDDRRMEVAAFPGSLSKAINCHITAGGEIEKRLAFVQQSGAATSTYGLAEQDDLLYVFGSGAKPATVPTYLTYQRLQHPSTATMTAVLDWDHFNGQLYVVAQFSDGSVYHYYNGSLVTDWYDGKARGSFTISGTPTTGAAVKSVTVNGIEILGTTVNCTGSYTNMASGIAAQITSYASSPEYTGVLDGPTVHIVASTTGTSSNGYAVSVEVTGGIVAGSVTNLTGGAAGTSSSPGSTVMTFKDKVYTVADTNVHFSAIREPTNFNINADGAGFVTPANHDGNSSELNALGPFLGKLGVFAREAIQIWHVEADDANNEFLQVIPNVGTTARRSIIPFQGRTVFLADNVLRALQRSENTEAVAEVFDIGGPIDSRVRAQCTSVGTTTADAAVGAVEPKEKRLMVAIGTKVYVLSLYPGINAWTEYEPGFVISDMVVTNRRLYVRGGDSIYLYGGTNFDTYDTSQVTVRVPYLDASRPSDYKDLQTIGVALEGLWTVKISTDPNDPSGSLVTEAVTAESRIGDDAIPANGRTTHIAVECTNNEAAYGRISQFVLGYARSDTAS